VLSVQPVSVTSSATGVLAAISHTRSAPLIAACDRHSALLALMLASSHGADCVAILGVRLEAGALARIGGLLASALLFVARAVIS
jgi:hypothetical protein